MPSQESYCLTRLQRWETTNLIVSYNTPLEIIEQLKLRLRQYINENNRDWAGFDMNIDKMQYQNSIGLIVAIQRPSPVMPSHRKLK